MSNYDTAEENRRKLPAIAVALSIHLGHGWRADIQAEHLVSVRRNGTDQALSLRIDWKNPQMVTITGSYPDGARDVYGVEYHSINVGVARSSEAMAKEVTRRLLPKYLDALAVVQDGIARNNERRDEQQRVADEIARRFPHLWRSKDGFDFSDGTSQGVARATFRLSVREGGSVHIDRVYGLGDQMMPVIAALAGE